MSEGTAQMGVWSGAFGALYTDRNTFDLSGLEAHYKGLYGVGRRAMNERIVGDLDRNLSILEVGCNTGNQLLCLKEMGFENLTGIELQDYALERARARLPDVALHGGSALALPFPDNAFDLVFTSGVLIHVAPGDLPRAMSEIHRVARRYVWGFEYYERGFQEIPYRGNAELMWKGPYPETFLGTFDDLLLLRQEAFKYRDAPNWDVMYLMLKREPGERAGRAA